MQKIMSVTEFEKELRKLFKDRQKSNPRYSSRAMSRDIGIAPSTFHKILTGERALGIRLAKEIAPRLAVTIAPVTATTSRRQVTQAASKFNALNPNSPAQLSWINLAILEMLKLDDFDPTNAWVARRLGMSLKQTEKVLAQMEVDGVLRRDGAQWTDLLGEAAVAAHNPLTTETTRQMIKDLLVVSQTKIDSIPYQRREHSFNIFPVAVEDFPKLRKKIVNLRREVMRLAEKSDLPKKDVYSLQLGFFPVTENSQEV